jgi:hypothetical protein
VKPFGQRTILWIVAASALGGLVWTASAESRESRRVQPVIENLKIEKPVFSRPGKAKPNPNIPPRIEIPPREEALLDGRGHEKVKRETLSPAPPNAVDIYRRPSGFQKMESFPHPNLAIIPRHYVPGHGNSLTAYRLDTRQRIREHCKSHDLYYFRNPYERKPDHER